MGSTPGCTTNHGTLSPSPTGPPDPSPAISMATVPRSNPTTSFLCNEPFSFIADTDSVSYVIDTGTNHIIINDAKLLRPISPVNDKTKGAGGTCICIAATGFLSLPLKLFNVEVHSVTDLPAVYVPTCPFNLLPPHILIQFMRSKGFEIDYFKHNDERYEFTYRPSS